MARDADWVTHELVLDRYTYKDGELYLKKPYKGITNYKVGSHKDKDGYSRVTIYNKGRHRKMMLHRIIFLYHHGYLPEIVDHIDHNVQNNDINNLREATSNQNQWNRKVKIKSKSGIRGIVIKKGIIYAQCKVNNIRYHLGSFNSIEEAEEALKIFRVTNHKEFASYER